MSLTSTSPIKLPKCQIRREIRGIGDPWFTNPSRYNGPVWRAELHDPESDSIAYYVAEFTPVLHADAVRLAHRIAAANQTRRIAAAQAQIESITP